MISLSVATLLLHPASLTLTCPAMTVEKVVAKMSELSGEPLKVVGAMEGRFIVVRFKDTPVQEALDRVAKVMNGKWVESGGIKILQSDLDAEMSTKEIALRNALRKYLATGSDEAPWTAKDAGKFVNDALALADSSNQAQDKWQKIQEFDAKGPMKRLIKRLTRLVGENVIAKLPEKSRLVFASHPTRMQRPLPSGATAAIDQFVREAKLQQEALQLKGFDRLNRPDMNYYTESLEPREIPATGLSRALLSVRKSLGSFTISLAMQGSDENVLTAVQTIGFQDASILQQQKSDFKVDGDYKPSEESVAIGKCMVASMGGRRSDSEVSPENRAKALEVFSDLETHELLSYTPSEVLLQTAEARNKDLVAALSDIAIMSFALFSTEQALTLQQFYNQGMIPWKLEEDEKGISVRSIDDFFGFNFKLARREMSKFTRQVAKSGLTIDAMADLIVTTPANDTSQVILMLAALPFPQLLKSADIFQGQDALRVYAHLDSGSRQKAKSGGFTTSFRSLPAAMQKAVTAYVYDEAISVNTNPVDMDAQYLYGSGVSIDSDSTTRFPNGVPPETQITLQVRDIESLFIINSYESGYSQSSPTTIENAANQLAWAEKRGSSGPRQDTKLATGSMKQLDLVVLFAKDTSNHSRFRLTPNFKDGDLKDVKDLPEAQRNALEEQIAKYREQFKNMNFGSGTPPKIKP